MEMSVRKKKKKEMKAFKWKCLLENIGLEIAEPEQVLTAVLVDHVLMQEVGVERRDPSQLQVLVERLLQILIQVAAIVPLNQ